MIVIAGVTGAGAHRDFEEHCRKAIADQRIFAEDSFCELEMLPTAVFGSGGPGLARPSAYSDPRFNLVADARLDNRADFATRLELSPTDLSGLRDPDLLLVAWSKWGAAALDLIAGAFAFAVYDRAEQSTTLVRDPFGERPLNYSIRDRVLSFASMPSGVSPDKRLTPSLDVLAEDLQNRIRPAEQSIFRGITRVAPGSLVEFANGSCRARRYWKPCAATLPPKREELVAQFRHLMDQAVAVRLPDHSSPISTTLSSGFDSSTVTGTAARLVASPNLLTAYTSAPPANDRLLLPPGRFADETPTAAETANILGIKHKIVRDSTPILSSIRGLSHYFQAPLPNPFNFSWMRAILDDVRQSGQSTILVAGEGNFTISYGGREILSALVRRGRWLRWFSETREVLRVHTHLRWRGALYGSFEPFLPPAVIRLLQVAFDRREYLSEFDFINPALRSDAPPPVVLSGDLLTDRAALLALHDDGERFKAMAALTGVEERDPTIDRRLVDFCLSLEPEHLLCRGEPRPLAREAFSDRVNPRVFDPSTRGYQSADWYARLHKSEALDTLEHIRNSSAAELLDLTKLQVAIERWPAFDTNAYATLFSFGRNVSQALNFGLFVAETERQSGRS